MKSNNFSARMTMARDWSLDAIAMLSRCPDRSSTAATANVNDRQHAPPVAKSAVGRELHELESRTAARLSHQPPLMRLMRAFESEMCWGGRRAAPSPLVRGQG